MLLFPLILLFDLLAYSLGHTLHGLGANPQVGQQFQVLSPLFKRLFASYLSHHATGPCTEARTDNVQFSILGDDPFATRVAVVIGSTDLYRTQDGDQSLVPVFDKSSGMTLAATNAGPLVSSAVGIEQFLQQTAPDPVRGGANRHLTGLQVDLPVLPDVSEGALHQPTYFLRRLGKNCFCNFFFRASNSFSSLIWGTGRRRQIFSLTSTNSRHTRRKTW